MQTRLTPMLFVLVLCGCATTTEPTFMRMRGLDAPIHLPASKANTGEVDGLDQLPRDNQGKIRANVLFIHGIGWTQDKSKLDFGRDFIDAVSQVYNVPAPTPNSASLCPRSTFNGSTERGGGVKITGPTTQRILFTDYIRHRSSSTDIACLDKQTIQLGERGSVTVYRILWDDILYNAYQYPQIGYDDALGSGVAPSPGYEDIDALRSSSNRELKTALVTYGLSDAAMYLGPIGNLIRTGIASALCLAIDDAAGRSSLLSGAKSAPSQIKAQDACVAATGGDRPAFAIVAESLGSRAIYDLLTQPATGTADTESAHEAIRKAGVQRLATTGNERVEVFLLANQIPLLGVGRLTDSPRATKLPKAVRFVAISEINDALTYELVPYFEHLALERCRSVATDPLATEPDCASIHEGDLANQLTSDIRDARKQIVENLGFDVVDIRVRFAIFQIYA